MKSINLSYKNGHFYDIEKQKRIELTDGAEVTLVTSDTNLLEYQTFVGQKSIIRSSQELRKRLADGVRKGNVQTYECICIAKTKLYFTIPIAVDNKSHTHYGFEVELLEDLYAVIKTSRKHKTANLYDCACKVIKNPSNNIDFFEEVYAKSLNEVYKNTYVHYFGNQGNPACNAMDKFYLDIVEVDSIRNKITIKAEQLDSLDSQSSDWA